MNPLLGLRSGCALRAGRLLSLCAALLSGFDSAALAQSTSGGADPIRPSPADPNARKATSESTTPAQPPADKSIVELTPFVLSEQAVTGYAATETLSGTRMRTNLKDVSASLSILTPEFIQDLGVTSFEKALEFTPSVNPDQGDAIGNGGVALRAGNGQSFSIRGFVGNATSDQSVSTDFFSGFGANDIYNTERVTVSLGPNALLIGVGNFRWRSAPVVGYRRTLDTTGRPGLVNVRNPIMGDETWDFGALIAWRHKLSRKVNLRVQLNIQNLLNETDPLLTTVDTDTSGVYGIAHAEVPVYYTLRRPRNFVLSTTFDF